MASAKELISRLFTGAKNVVNTLDRDKVSPGFQVLSPQTKQFIGEGIQRVRQVPLREFTPFTAQTLPGGANIPSPVRQFRSQALQGLTFGLAKNKEQTPKTGADIAGSMLGSFVGMAPSFGGLTKIATGLGAGKLARLPRVGVDLGIGAITRGLTESGTPKQRLQAVKQDVTSPTSLAFSALLPFSASTSSMSKIILENLPEIKSALSKASGLDSGLLKPKDAIQFFGDLDKAAKKFIPTVVNSREMKKLSVSNPTQWVKTVKTFLEDAMVRASEGSKNIDVGLSTQELKKAPWDQKIPGMVEGLGVVPKKGKIPTRISQDEASQQLTRAVMAEEEPKLFKDLFSQWIGKRSAAETTGAEQGFNFTSIPRNKGKDVIQVAEGTLKSTDPEINAAATQYKATTDALFQQIKQQAKRAGVKDLGYIENYVTHYWKQDPKQVQQVMRTLSKSNPSFKGRQFLTYKEGIDAGLTPKYDNPAQIMSEYVTRLEQTKANLDLFEQLRASGLVVPTGVGSKQPGFIPIKAPGFPMSTTNINGKVVEGSYYAPDSIARQINRIFSPEEFGKPGKVFDITAKVSSGLQNMVLSGGVPGTPINAFSFAQILKSVTSGNIRTPLKALAVSLSPKKSLQYFNAKAPIIKEMELRNIPIRSSFNTQDLMGIQKTAGGYWDAAMSDPTFKRFMPAMQIDLYERIKNTAIRRGVDPEQAADTAAKAVQNFYGTPSTADIAQRTSLGEDLKTTFLFAPQFREAMINFWGNTLKSLKNPLTLENRENIKFLVGSTATLAAMNHLNQIYNGHSMSENPKGKEDKLLIPVGDTTIGIPFLSSIATVPRGVYRIGKSLLNLDLKNAGADTLRTFGSIPLKAMGELIMNEDYFGNQIYDQDGGIDKKAKDIAGYLFKNNTHPWLKAGLEAGNKPLYQTISQAVEAPIRYYKTSSIENAPFWSSYDMAKKAQDKFIELRYKDPNEAILFYNQNKSLLDSVDTMKEQVKAYYESGQDSTFLKNNGVVQTDDHVAFIGNDGKFHLIDKNFDYKPPKLTGLENLDKKILSSATSEITAMEKNVLTLFENNMMTANEAEQTLTKMAAYKDAIKKVTGSRKAKKPKKIAIQKLKTSPRIKTGRHKTRRIKLQAIKSAKIKPLQVKPLTVNVKKYL